MTYESLLTAVMSSAKPESVVAATQAKVAALDPADQSRDAVVSRAGVMLHRDWIRHNFRREKLKRLGINFLVDILLCPQFTVPAIAHDHRPFEDRTIVDGQPRPYFETLFWAGIVVASHLPSTVFPTGLGSDVVDRVAAGFGPYQDRRTIEVSRLISDAIVGSLRLQNLLNPDKVAPWDLSPASRRQPYARSSCWRRDKPQRLLATSLGRNAADQGPCNTGMSRV